MLSREARTDLEESGYRIIGHNNHSAVKICRWTRKSILDSGFCYKQKFYEDIHGIKSHRCLQMTPSLPFCDNKCVFCWRNTDLNTPAWRGGMDEPRYILDEAIRVQKLLLSGFKGNPSANMSKWRESREPNLCAISLDGEPTIYPELSELIEECHYRNITPFLVTNGQHPEKLRDISEPSQLYISMAAPDRETYIEACRPLTINPWEKLIESLKLMPSFNCIKVIRLTLARDLNFKNPSDYAKLIEIAEPDFIEAKSYVAVGHSRSRLGLRYMLKHSEIKEFSYKLSRETNYRLINESRKSRVTLLKK